MNKWEKRRKTLSYGRIEHSRVQVTKLKNHPFATITVLADSGKNNQRKLKPVGETLLRNRVFTYTVSEYLSKTAY